MSQNPSRRNQAAVLLLLAACSTPQEYRQQADEEVYALLDQRRAELFDKEAGFRVDRNPDALRQRLLQDVDNQEVLPLNIARALEIAAENNRDFQTQREQLYRSALDLSFERWRFSWQPSLSGRVESTGNGATSNANLSADLGMSKLFGSGALVLGNIGTSLMRALDRGDGWDALQSINLSFTMPLLRGAAREVVLEPLTQAERNLVYAVRQYERFRRTFAVDVATRYYDLLRTLDNISNEQANYDSLKLLRVRNQRLAEAGKLTDIQVDQAKQDQLRSESRLLRLQESYDRQLDQFALLLGLPTETRFQLERAELEELRQIDGSDIEGLDAKTLGEFALQHRLDQLNLVDQQIDAERHARVAADALRTGLDLDLSVAGTSEEGRPLSYRSGFLPWSVGLGFDLPIDQLPERNAYRRSLLDWDRAIRATEASRDSVLAQVYDDLRQLASTRQRYQIQLSAVELAAKRVRSAQLKLEAGRSSTRDVLEAQSALLNAQNSTTSNLIDFALARLRLYRDLELLDVDQSGILLNTLGLPRTTP